MNIFKLQMNVLISYKSSLWFSKRFINAIQIENLPWKQILQSL